MRRLVVAAWVCGAVLSLSPAAGADTVTYQTAASADDTYCSTGSNAYTNYTMLWPSFSASTQGFVRFALTVPAGATIQSAYLTVKSNGSQGSAAASTVRVQRVDSNDCASFSSNPYSWAVTAGYVDWTLPSTWTGGSWYTSPDIGSPVQEFINLPGYASGKHLGLRGQWVSGPYKYIYQWDNGSHADGAQLTVNYVVGNVPPVAEAGNNQTVTDSDGDGSETVTLDGSGSSDSDGTITSYVWQEGTTQLATSSTAAVSLAVGVHTISLTVTDDGGATASDTVQITVNDVASNVPPVAEAGNNQTVTDSNGNGSETVTLDGSGSSDSDGTITSYVWQEGTTQLATSSTAVVSLAVGVHTISLTVTDDDGATASDTAQITVNSSTGQSNVVVNAAVRYQTMDGFGGAEGWSVPTAAKYSQIFDDLGVSILRFRMPGYVEELTPGQPGDEARDNDNNDPFVIDWNHVNMTSINNLAPLLQAAQARGCRIYGSAWCPPCWMKTSGLASGPTPGTLKAGYEDEMAEFVMIWVQGLQMYYNVHMNYVGPQNEPDYATAAWECCGMSAAQITTLTKKLGQRFAAAGISTRVCPPETSRLSPYFTSYANTICADPVASSYVHRLATHQYGGANFFNADALIPDWIAAGNLAAGYGKPLWSTEYCLDYSTLKGTWLEAINLVQHVHNALVHANVSAWLYWEICWGDNSAMINNAGVTYPKFYALKNYFRYIRPGATRLDATSSDGDVLATAFQNDADQAVTLVMVNRASAAKTVQCSLNGLPGLTNLQMYRSSATENCVSIGSLAVSGGGFNCALPAQSITTFTDTVLPTADMAVSAALDYDWVYQNTPLSTGNLHHSILTVTIARDIYANTAYTCTVTQSGAGVVSIADTGNPLVKNVFGGQRSDGVTGTGTCSLHVVVTGDVAGTASTDISINVRPLGDIEGSGEVDTDDKALLNRALNTMSTPGYQDRHFDLTGDGNVDTDDKALLNRVLNTMTIP